MANYCATARTNYFRVTDEESYQKLFEGLICEDTVFDFTRERDGVTYHAFGAYDAITFDPSGDGEECDYDFDAFLRQIQEILPKNEAFIYMESGGERLRYVSGCAVVVTRRGIEWIDIHNEALNRARKMLRNPIFQTSMEY